MTRSVARALTNGRGLKVKVRACFSFTYSSVPPGYRLGIESLLLDESKEPLSYKKIAGYSGENGTIHYYGARDCN